jgi:phosphopantothenoylcysteine synthetase/decarboxylase
MNQSQPSSRGVLYNIVCASSAAAHAPDFASFARSNGWDVWVIATPQAHHFLDVAFLEDVTGHPVYSEYRRPEDPHTLPQADAIVVLPATFNTINKWALGIADTLALGLLCECIGLGIPILAVPRGLYSLDRHPAFSKSVEILQECGVRVLYQPELYSPSNRVPDPVILDSLDQILAERQNEAH